MKRILILLVAALMTACGGRPVMPASTSALPGSVQPKIVQQGRSDSRFLVFPQPGGQTNLYPFQMTLGPDGKVWFTVQQYDGGGQVGNIDNNGIITEYPIPVRAYPWDITTGPDGKLWFVDTRNNVLGNVTTTGAFTIYSAQTYGSITSGPQRAVWFAGGPGIGKITMTGTITYYSLPYRVLAVTAGHDGNLWFTNGQITDNPMESPNTFGQAIVGKMTPSGAYTIYNVPNSTGQGVGITAGHDGNVWALIENGSAPAMVVRVKPNGAMKVFDLPSDILGVDNNRIISAPSGELWFTHNNASPLQYIGRISLTGHITEWLYPTPDRFVSYLGGLAYGKDGNVYFSQTNPIQDGVGVFLRHELDVTPASLTLRTVGQSKSVTVTEHLYSGPWNGSTSDPNVATVSAGSSNTFVIQATGAGSAIITISDPKDNNFELPVTVL